MTWRAKPGTSKASVCLLEAFLGGFSWFFGGGFVFGFFWGVVVLLFCFFFLT